MRIANRTQDLDEINQKSKPIPKKCNAVSSIVRLTFSHHMEESLTTNEIHICNRCCFFNLWSLYFLSRILLGRSWITISFRFPSVFLMISNVSTLQVLITRNFWSLTASWFSFFELYLLTLLTCKYSCFRNYFVSTYIFTFFERVNISNIVTYEVDIATNLYTEELDTWNMYIQA